MKELILEMEDYAQEKNVPIIEKKSIAFIMKYIKDNNVKNILEIGAAIGYSAILMASATNDAFVTTIERDEERYMECLKNVKKCGLDKKINVVFQDALDVNLSEDLKYDLIFIDAAKGQYERFFEKYKYFLKEDGAIITDNLKFHGYVGKSDKIESKNLKGLVQKIENYIDFLKENEEFDTTFYDIGDGLSVSTWKDEK
ncbi:MAG: O-methyltransferase [Bacilli bacterium]|nr:O-methyltransferase [Bacilli bacterium]MBQ8901485.1 O-methyltransferase [Bacilli bacterium]